MPEQEKTAAGSKSENLLDISGVAKTYDGNVYALTNIDFHMRRGEFVSIIGSSGAGKSTLLRCINGLHSPSSGSIVFDGQEVTKLRGKQLRHLRRRISMVFQGYNLVYRSSAIENVLQGRLGYHSSLSGALGIFAEEEKKRAFEMLDHVGLSDFAYTRADQLSGGQKQRVGIARALVQDPLLILADEPIASLDPKSSRTVLELLRWACDDLGVACLVSLHQVEFAVQFSDRIIGLANGELLFDGNPQDLSADIVRKIYGDDEDAVTSLEIGKSHGQ